MDAINTFPVQINIRPLPIAVRLKIYENAMKLNKKKFNRPPYHNYDNLMFA